MKKGFFIISFLLFVISCKQSFTDIVSQTERAVFHIYSYDEHGVPNGTGTGFFIDRSGIGITNHHVIEDADIAYIKDFEGNVFQIEQVTKVDVEADLAEIKIKNDDNYRFPRLKLSAKQVLKGQEIFVIGNPETYESTLTTGIISAIRKNDHFEEIQVSAPISPGSSGSPIMDMKGYVLGVITSSSSSEKAENLNFGTSIKSLSTLKNADDVIANLNSNEKTYLLNQHNSVDHTIVLNSIQLLDSKTIVNMTFSNLQLCFDPCAIWTDIGHEKSYYIQDLRTNEKYPLLESSLGSSIDPTLVGIAETVRYSLTFSSLSSSVDSIALIMEDFDSFTFSSINLMGYKPNLDDAEIAYSNVTLNYALNDMQDSSYYDAFSRLDYLNDIVEGVTHQSFYTQTQGVTAFLYGDTIAAKELLQEAVDQNPSSSLAHSNLYYINNSLNLYNEALQHLNAAITLDPDQIDYRQQRVSLYYNLEEYAKMMDEATYCIETTPTDDWSTPHLYFDRVIAKIYLNLSPCDDMLEAYNHQDAPEWIIEEVEQYYSQYCD
tara:strand:- start:2143 stop:3780 length:1638 start_codon:yes stop_codon:yes gene_type:complete